jgi:DNA-binding transcriptional LysR family regulator
MSRRHTSLLALRAFEAAARRLSFTNAAHELHVSQAAVSRHVRALEAEIGRPLFRRLHRQVELTSAGERLASGLAAGFSQIWRAVETARGVPAQRLRISVNQRSLPGGLCRASGDSQQLIRNSKSTWNLPTSCEPSAVTRILPFDS